ncbi:Nramp family divalent metal transporter [Actinopolyspora halophila]|uniref:Nramp family divalent metal transporter n=1 Tax=Actinopolyspora halophila TaxID=1850 RepID=UPI0003747611|nr:Nramp family divalent metal transporter [Actinopolyspora halophila]
MEQEEDNKATVATPDKAFMGRIRKFGPGIVAVLSMMGAGDLVTASVSGSSYGYNLMWLLALSLVVRFVIVNLMGRYQVLNLKGNTIVEGYSDVSKYYPWFIGIAILVSGHFFNAYMITGAGEALSWVFNIGHPFLWSCAVVLFSLFVIGHNVYNTIENLLKVLLTLMTIAFLGLAIYSVPDLGGIARGTVGFGIPRNTGAFGVFAVALSLIGAVAGSMANFLYPYFVKEKDWKGVRYKKTQRNDIMFGICAAIVINLAVWVVGAEILSPNNIEVSSLEDISKALSLHLGNFGAIVFYLGAFGILYSSVIGYANGFPKIIVDCLHMIRPERREKFGQKFDDDPWFKWFSLFILVSPVVWSIPGMPGFVEMAIFVTGMQAVVVPITAIGLMILVNKSSHLGEHKASVTENIVLILTTALAIWVSIEAVVGWF